MTGWDEVLTTALLGTERRPFTLERLGDVLDGSAVHVGGAEAGVLAAAAVLSAYRRAGRLPGHAPADLPEPAPADDRPVCSETALQVLSLLLGGMVEAPSGNDELIGEWLQACIRAGQRPPEDLLARLLEFGTDRAALRVTVAAVAGPRGAWLAAANPEWSWASAGATAAVRASDEGFADRYRAGFRAERIALLEALRSDNRDTARELLRSGWATEPAADRAALLGSLAAGLDDDDEPFLESVLDDRAASVRAVAAELLDGLPRSRRAARMAERARPLVRLEGRFRRRILVELPERLDAAARRDGITDTRIPGAGLKATWLMQIVAATPLDVWEEHLAVEPVEAVRLARAQPELLAGWEQAAIRQRNEGWAIALLALRPSPVLVSVLSPATAVSVVDDALRSRSLADPPLIAMVAAVPGPWTSDFSERVVGRIRNMPEAVGRSAVPLLSTRLAPSALPAVEGWIDGLSGDYVRRDVRKLAHALSIRLTIAQEFA